LPYPYDTWGQKLTAPLGEHVTFFLYLAGFLFTFIYSAPELGRTKIRGMLANFTIAIPRGVLLKVAGWAMVAHVAFTEPWYIGGVIGLFLLGAASTKDFADMEGDRAGGCKTLPLLYGVRKAAWMISPFFILPWLLVPLGAYLPDPQNPAHPILTGNPYILTAFGAIFTPLGRLHGLPAAARPRLPRGDGEPSVVEAYVSDDDGGSGGVCVGVCVLVRLDGELPLGHADERL